MNRMMLKNKYGLSSFIALRLKLSYKLFLMVQVSPEQKKNKGMLNAENGKMSGPAYV